MTNYSQRDIRWSWKKLGTGGTSIGGFGCAITALGNMVNKRPDEVNQILINGGGFLAGNLVIWDKACQLLGLNNATGTPTIAQVRGNGFPMHFVVWLGGGQIIDSWDGRQKTNPYLFVSFRAVSLKSQPAPIPPSSGVKIATVTKTMNVRSQPTVASSITSVLHAGDTFKYDTVVDGQNVQGSNKWVHSLKNHYVHRSGVKL